MAEEWVSPRQRGAGQQAGRGRIQELKQRFEQGAGHSASPPKSGGSAGLSSGSSRPSPAPTPPDEEEEDDEDEAYLKEELLALLSQSNPGMFEGDEYSKLYLIESLKMLIEDLLERSQNMEIYKQKAHDIMESQDLSGYSDILAQPDNYDDVFEEPEEEALIQSRMHLRHYPSTEELSVGEDEVFYPNPVAEEEEEDDSPIIKPRPGLDYDDDYYDDRYDEGLYESQQDEEEAVIQPRMHLRYYPSTEELSVGEDEVFYPNPVAEEEEEDDSPIIKPRPDLDYDDDYYDERYDEGLYERQQAEEAKRMFQEGGHRRRPQKRKPPKTFGVETPPITPSSHKDMAYEGMTPRGVFKQRQYTVRNLYDMPKFYEREMETLPKRANTIDWDDGEP